MADDRRPHESDTIELLTIQNVGIDVNIVMLGYIEAEIHLKLTFKAAILDFKMADDSWPHESDTIELLTIQNMGIDVNIVMLGYIEAEIHEKLTFKAAILDFKMADDSWPHESDTIELLTIQIMGIDVNIVVLGYIEAEIHEK